MRRADFLKKRMEDTLFLLRIYEMYNKKTGPFPVELGDVFISYEKIIEQAKSYNHSTKREFAFLVTHGLLHLLGFDHLEKNDEEEMFSLQEEILNKVKILRS